LARVCNENRAGVTFWMEQPFSNSIYEPLMESPFVLDVQYSKDDRTILYTGSGDTRSNRKGGVR